MIKNTNFEKRICIFVLLKIVAAEFKLIKEKYFVHFVSFLYDKNREQKKR